MAEEVNFDDAYATDSCDKDSWEGICRHVGLSYGESGDEQDAGSKDGQEGTDLTVEGTGEAVEATDETVEPTDQAVELRKDLKQLCRITKLQQKQLEKWTTNVDKSLVAEVKSTYKSYFIAQP